MYLLTLATHYFFWHMHIYIYLDTLLYIVLACLMLFAALTNAVCLNNASFFFLFFLSLICANAFYFHALSLFISFFLFA